MNNFEAILCQCQVACIINVIENYMNRDHLLEQIRKKKSFLCVGLDADAQLLPDVVRQHGDPVFAFNKAIIDATASYAVAFKPNTAFYEARGADGWESLQRTIAYIKEQYPEVMVIADAKRGDIGNTSQLYARAFFEQMQADAVTVAPYMGFDSVAPFLGFKHKWVILLALTSNKGSSDFQYLTADSQQPFYIEVVKKAIQWAHADQLMFVVGATHPAELAGIRQHAPDYFFLVPGVGAQGGDLAEVAHAGMNSTCGLLVNASRSIIFASSSEDFAEAAATEAQRLQLAMEELLLQKGIL